MQKGPTRRLRLPGGDRRKGAPRAPGDRDDQGRATRRGASPLLKEPPRHGGCLEAHVARRGPTRDLRPGSAEAGPRDQLRLWPRDGTKMATEGRQAHRGLPLLSGVPADP